MNAANVLEIQNLKLSFPIQGSEILRGIDLILHPSTIHAIVGESGAGKTMCARAIMGIASELPGVQIAGNLLVNGIEHDWQACKRSQTGISYIFQDPIAFLNPIMRLSTQVQELLQQVHGRTHTQSKIEATELLLSLGMDATAARRFPHQLSGGMQQRAMAALALVGNPRILIADEPASALDMVSRQQTYTLLSELRDVRGMSILVISHDLASLNGFADQISVMYAGQIVETRDASEFFNGMARHPYSQALIKAQPNAKSRGNPLYSLPGHMPTPYIHEDGCLFETRCEYCLPLCKTTAAPVINGSRCHRETIIPSMHNLPKQQIQIDTIKENKEKMNVLLEVKDLHLTFDNKPILSGVSFTLHHGEILGLIGGSGSGKTSISRCLAGLEHPDTGHVTIDGVTVADAQRNWKHELAKHRQQGRGIQLIFQDTWGSLDPRWTVRQCMEESLQYSNKVEREKRIHELLDHMSLSSHILAQKTFRLSGGQRQRIVIARALACNPRILILDEPFSRLDVSVQAQVLGVIQSIQTEFALSYLFISHDLDIIQYISDRVLVLADGFIVESGDPNELWKHAKHPFTKQLAATRLDIQTKAGANI